MSEPPEAGPSAGDESSPGDANLPVPAVEPGPPVPVGDTPTVPLIKPEPPPAPPPPAPPPPPPEPFGSSPSPYGQPGQAPAYGQPPPFGEPPPYAPPDATPAPGYGPPAAYPTYGGPEAPAYPPYAPPRLDGVAVSSLAIAVLGIPMLFCFCMGVPMCIVGIVMGFIGRHRIREAEGRLSGDGICLAAIIVGAAGLAIFTLMTLSFLVPGSRTSF